MTVSADEDRLCGCQRDPIARRSFLRLAFLRLASLRLGLAGILTLLWPRRVLARKVALRLARVPKLRKPGAFVILRLLGREVLIVRTAVDAVHAFPAFCTHKRSRLKYDRKRGQILCPNHGSRFSVGGKVLNGPAEKDLKPLSAKLDKARERILLRL